GQSAHHRTRSAGCRSTIPKHGCAKASVNSMTIILATRCGSGISCGTSRTCPNCVPSLATGLHTETACAMSWQLPGPIAVNDRNFSSLHLGTPWIFLLGVLCADKD